MQKLEWKVYIKSMPRLRFTWLKSYGSTVGIGNSFLSCFEYDRGGEILFVGKHSHAQQQRKKGINAQLFSQATDIPFPYPHHKILLHCLAQLAWISKQVTVALQQSLIKFQYNYRCMYDFYSGKNSSSFFKHAKDTVTWECVLATEGFEEVREGFTD